MGLIHLLAFPIRSEERVYLSSGVPDVSWVVGVVICQVVIDSRLLVLGHSKIVAEPTTRVSALLASSLRFIDGGFERDRGSTDRSDIWASCGECWVESLSIRRLRSYPST